MKTDHKVIIGIIVLTLIVMVGGVWLSDKEGAKNSEKLSKPLMGEKVADQGGAHVSRESSHSPYNSNTPTSGPHWADGTAGPGIKYEPVADELVVHSMEHGAAVLWYKDDLPQSDVDRLKKVFIEASGKKIMLPRKGLDVPVALTSWNYLLKLQTIDEVKIKEFIEINNDRAPEKEPI